MKKAGMVTIICLLIFLAFFAGSCELSNYNGDGSSPSQSGIWQGCYKDYGCMSGSGTPGHCPDYVNDLGFPVGENHPLIKSSCH
jgi:hypothetical protein